VLESARSPELNRAEREANAGGYYEGLIGVDGEGARGELAMALLGKPSDWTRFNAAGVSRQLQDDFLYFELKPDLRRKLFGHPFTTNRHGMRDRECTVVKPEGVYRIAVLGSSIDMGWGVGTEVTYVNVTAPNMLAALQTGSVDIGSTTEPYVSLILDKLPGSTEVTRGGGVSEARIGLVALDSWLKANAALADRPLAGFYEASQFTRQNPDKAAAACATFLPDLEPKVLAASLKRLDFDPRWAPAVQQSFDNATQILVDNKTIPTKPSTPDLVALDLLSNQTKYQQYFSDLK
jgi:hypothetical protein